MARTERCRDVRPITRICALDPRIAELLARAWADRRRYSHALYGPHGLKAELMQLVGWYRPVGPDELRTQEAWDVALWALDDAIPHSADAQDAFRRCPECQALMQEGSGG